MMQRIVHLLCRYLLHEGKERTIRLTVIFKKIVILFYDILTSFSEDLTIVTVE